MVAISIVVSRLVVSVSIGTLFSPMLVSLRQMWFNDSSVPFNRVVPSGVKK